MGVFKRDAPKKKHVDVALTLTLQTNGSGEKTAEAKVCRRKGAIVEIVNGLRRKCRRDMKDELSADILARYKSRCAQEGRPQGQGRGSDQPGQGREAAAQTIQARAWCRFQLGHSPYGVR